jgi:hypothetical protein
MHVVVIYSLDDNKESMSEALAASLGTTTYEAAARLRVPGSGPLTVAVFAEKNRAVGLLEKLQSTGFSAFVLTSDEIEMEGRALIVRRFSLGGRDLSVTTDKGDGISIPFQKIELILRGTAIAHDVATETVKNRSLSLGRAVLSGGMMITKTTKNVREITTEERQGFVNLYIGNNPTLVFFENGLVYDSLGSAMRQSRSANFAYLVAELRRRCPDSLYDERLLRRAGQVAILGPSLNPEEHLIVATALLQKMFRSKRR